MFYDPMRLVVGAAAVSVALAGCTSDGTKSTAVGELNGTSISTQMATPTSAQKPQSPSVPPDVGMKSVTPDVGMKEALGDVELGPIRVDGKLGTPSAEVTITNQSGKRSNYIIDLGITGADGITNIDSAMVSAQGLAPGQTAKRSVTFRPGQILPEGAKLIIVGVARLAA